VTLTLSFSNVLDDSLWSGPQSVGILEVHSRGVPEHDGVAATGVFEGEGTIERTILIADPVPPGVPGPSTWAMLLIGFAGVGFMAYRRVGRCIALLERPTFQSRFQLPDRRIAGTADRIERDAGAGLTAFESMNDNQCCRVRDSRVRDLRVCQRGI
jgi:hypothetical protein